MFISGLRIAVVGGLLVGGSGAMGQEFSYPELNVTPRASARLESEAKEETLAARMINQLPIQISGLGTMVAGFALDGNAKPGKDVDGVASTLGILVGAAWIGIGTGVGILYTPYSDAWERIKNLPSRSTREQLLRERLAEEAIERASRNGWRLTLLSVLTNLGFATYMGLKADMTTFAFPATIGALTLSIGPLIFPYNWWFVHRDHQDYKKRIYGPVSAAPTLLLDQSSGKYVPGLAYSVSF